MAKKIKEIRVGSCAVRIYRDVEWDEYAVKTIDSKGRVVGGRDGGYFTSDSADARNQAAYEVRVLRAGGRCK